MPSASLNASSKKASDCSFQARGRDSLMMTINCPTSPSVNRRRKSPAVVGSGIRLCSHAVEVDLAVAAHFEVLQALPAREEVVGDVQDVVALEARQAPLQEVEALVDVVDEPDLMSQEGNGPDAAR